MQTILVTGASRGLGLEFVRQYAAAGERVYAACRNPESATKLQSLAAEYPGHVIRVAMDVADEASIRSAYNEIATLTDSLDLLINNAGVADMARIDSVTSADFLRIYTTNVVGAFLVARSFAPLLARGTNPRLICISSGLGSIGTRDPLTTTHDYAYSASKAALNMVTKQLSFDLKAQGITVIAQCPGWVRTDMGGAAADLSPEESIRMLRGHFALYTLSDTGRYFTHKGVELGW
ncbi:MAG: SDR family oxidoreductase [Verrucomicrobiota bacterium]|nr:SDR family oxidoreductase [Verrucomicrobiota bacterium]